VGDEPKGLCFLCGAKKAGLAEDLHPLHGRVMFFCLHNAKKDGIPWFYENKNIFQLQKPRPIVVSVHSEHYCCFFFETFYGCF